MTIAVLALAAAALALGGIPTGSADVVPECAADPAITWNESSVSVEYGTDWGLYAKGVGAVPGSNTFSGKATMSGASASSYGVADFWDMDACTVSVSIYPRGPLAPGTYTAVAEEGNTLFSVKTAPATLTVTKAALGLTTTALADPSNPRNTILSAEFTGAWLDQFREYYGSTTTTGAPVSPAGTWKLQVTDASGAVVHEESVERSEKSDTFGVSSFWADSPAGEYQLAVSFTPSGSGSTYFTVTNPQAQSFTVAGAAPGDASTASPAPELPSAAITVGSTLPLWVPLVAGVLTAGLLAFLIVQIVRTARVARRPAAGASPEVTA